MSQIFDFYRAMKDQNVMLAYHGNVSDELLGEFFRLAEDKLSRLESKTTTKKRVFNILVEILQNLYHHIGDLNLNNDEQAEVIAVILLKTDSGYDIMTGNQVLNSRIDQLKARIDEINSLSTDELRDRYRQKLGAGQLSARGGAGLGLIDIVRKSGNKLDYEFERIDEQYSFFTLIVNIWP